MKYLKLTTEQALSILEAKDHCNNCNDCILNTPAYKCDYLIDCAMHHMEQLKANKGTIAKTYRMRMSDLYNIEIIKQRLNAPNLTSTNVIRTALEYLKTSLSIKDGYRHDKSSD